MKKISLSKLQISTLSIKEQKQLKGGANTNSYGTSNSVTFMQNLESESISEVERD